MQFSAIIISLAACAIASPAPAGDTHIVSGGNGGVGGNGGSAGNGGGGLIGGSSGNGGSGGNAGGVNNINQISSLTADQKKGLLSQLLANLL